MGNAPKKKWPLDVLVKRAEPALAHPELVRIAATSQSPTRAANEAEENGCSKDLIQACRWLAMIANDYPEYFSAVVASDKGEKSEMKEITCDGPEITIEIWPKTDDRELSLSQIKEALTKMRQVSSIVSQLPEKEFETSVECGRVDIAFPLEYGIQTRMITKRGKEYIEIASGKQKRNIRRSENKLNLGAQTGEPRGSVTYDRPTLIIELFPELPHDERYNHKYTDRGLCWVYSGSPATCHMELQNWNDPEISVEELTGFVELAKRRAEEVIEAVLNKKS